MKIILIFLITILFSSGCFVDSAKVVETEKQTTKCIVGKWMPEDKENNLTFLEFRASSAGEGKSGTIVLSEDFEEPNGTWQYQNIREIGISTQAGEHHFELLNCERGIFDNSTIYVKQE